MADGRINLAFGWSWLLLGLIVGVVMGLFFAREDWLGGYDAWRRRLVRLGHVALIGTGILNILLGLTIRSDPVALAGGRWAGILMIGGAVAMPVVCFLAAWRKPLRQLFFIPVLCLLAAAATIAAALVFSD